MLRCPTLQTRSLYVEYERRYSHLKNVTWPGQPFCLYRFPWLLTALMVLNPKIDFISFRTLQTRSLYVEYERRYSHLKFTYIQDHFISLYTRPFKIYLYTRPYWNLLIYKTILFPYIQDHFKFTYIQDHFVLTNQIHKKGGGGV